MNDKTQLFHFVTFLYPHDPNHCNISLVNMYRGNLFSKQLVPNLSAFNSSKCIIIKSIKHVQMYMYNFFLTNSLCRHGFDITGIQFLVWFVCFIYFKHVLKIISKLKNLIPFLHYLLFKYM